MIVRVKKDLLGKTVIDSRGKNIGNVADVEVDLETMAIGSIVITVTAISKESESRFKKILGKVRKRNEMTIPVSYIQAVSDYVILKIALEDLLDKGER